MDTFLKVGEGLLCFCFSDVVFHFIDAGNVDELENLEDIEDKDMKEAFERWKSKSYALTVPLRIVALEGSVPPVWIKVHFVSFQSANWLNTRPLLRKCVWMHVNS